MIGTLFRNLSGHILMWTLFLLVSSAGSKHALAAETAETVIVDRIVAVVNDEIISLSELNQSLKPYEERVKSVGYAPEQQREMLDKVRGDILNQLIDQKLTDQKIKESNITVSDSEIDSSLERFKEARSMTDEELRSGLAGEGLTMEAFRERIREQIMRSKLVNLEIKSKIVITKEDAKAYYESHAEDYGGQAQYHLRNIILTVSPAIDAAEKQEAREKLEQILEQFKSGASFTALAAKYSHSALASEGGDLGLFRLDQLSPQIQAAVKGLKAGEVTPVLETDQGYQIFLVEEILKNPGKSLEEASPEIEQKLFQDIVEKKFSSWLEDLRRQSHIKIIK